MRQQTKPNHRLDLHMSERATSNMNLGLLWTILFTMAAGVYQAGQIRERIDRLAEEVRRVRILEERVLRIETKIGVLVPDSKEVR